jgi:cell division protein FtsI/penicillin-binding protein 2
MRCSIRSGDIQDRMSVGRATRLRLIVVMALLGVALLIVTAQLLRWQVFDRAMPLAYAQHGGSKWIQKSLKPQRGLIYDYDGVLLACNLTTYSVGASPNAMPDEIYRRKFAEKMAPLLGQEPAAIMEKIADANRVYVRLADHVSQETAREIARLNYLIVTLEERTRRVYPHGSLAAHLLGFVTSDLAGYRGSYGVEGFYESVLRGKPGIGVAEPDPWGEPIPVAMAHYTPPEDGKNIYLSIRQAAQHLVERELAQALQDSGAESGTVVVLQPRTGAIIAMASLPAYDPNQYAGEAYETFIDPAISKIYEPGSVIKVVTVAAALDSGAVDQNEIFYDPGAIEVGGSPIYNPDKQAHGHVDLTTVLGKSLNVEAAQIAVRLGPERFYHYLRRFGFGSLTGVDLAGEVPGGFKTPKDPEWSESDLGTNSFGQAIAATPLQVAVAIASVANGGLLMGPYVVQAITDNDGNSVITPPKPIRRTVTAQTAHAVTRMLEKAVEQETVLARVPGYRVAGKSGTAQVYVAGGYHPTATIASFVGYLPVDDPAVLILVVLRRPQTSPWGSQVAAPVFARIAKALMVLLDVPPDAVRQRMTDLPTSTMQP